MCLVKFINHFFYCFFMRKEYNEIKIDTHAFLGGSEQFKIYKDNVLILNYLNLMI